MEQGRRELIKKAAAGGAIAWTAPVVVSSAAFAHGTQQCPGFSIATLAGPECRPSPEPGGRWALQWTVNAPADVQVTLDGCIDQPATSINDGYLADYSFDDPSCSLTITTEEIDSNGAVLCAEVLQHYFLCPG